jgi:hypothetical protein
MSSTLIFGIRFEVWMVALTIAITFTAVIQALIYSGMHRTTKTIERAYVDLSHVAPGLDNVGPNKAPTIRVRVKNSGRTPADVIAVVLEPFISDQPLPDAVPDIRTKAPQHFFLMPQDSIWWEPDDPLPSLSEETHREITREGTSLKLWIIGYVDYIDRFERRHRTRFARCYSPRADREALINQIPMEQRNNLAIEAKPGYNTENEIDKQGKLKDLDQQS